METKITKDGKKVLHKNLHAEALLKDEKAIEKMVAYGLDYGGAHPIDDPAVKLVMRAYVVGMLGAAL